MRKILIVGDFSSDTSDVNSFLEQHFHTQLCTDSGKIVKSMLKMYAPDLVLMDIDGFENLHEEVFEAIKEYNPDLPVITYGRDDPLSQKIVFTYSSVLKPLTNVIFDVFLSLLFVIFIISTTIMLFKGKLIRIEEENRKLENTVKGRTKELEAEKTVRKVFS